MSYQNEQMTGLGHFVDPSTHCNATKMCAFKKKKTRSKNFTYCTLIVYYISEGVFAKPSSDNSLIIWKFAEIAKYTNVHVKIQQHYNYVLH